jgi:predicted nucleic acid-binding protein
MTAVKIAVDTYAWIELLIGSEKGTKVKELLENADEVYTPDTVLAETARKFLREGTDEETIKHWIEIITNASTVMPIDPAIALEAAKCYLELVRKAKSLKQNTPGLFDAIVYATAKTKGCKIVTGDEHFKNLSEVLWIGQ